MYSRLSSLPNHVCGLVIEAPRNGEAGVEVEVGKRPYSPVDMTVMMFMTGHCDAHLFLPLVNEKEMQRRY